MTIYADLDPEMTAETKEKYNSLIEFGKNIDFTPLFDKIKEKLGLDCIEFDTPILCDYNRKDMGYGNLHVRCKSENIVKHAGVFTSIMDELHIAFGSTCIYYSKEVEQVILWAVIDFTYSFAEGGSNGNELCAACYSEKDEWTIRFRKQD